MATEMRPGWLRPQKKIIENFSFDRFLLCFQGSFNDKLRKKISYYLKFGQESGNTLFLIFSYIFSNFLRNLILLKL